MADSEATWLTVGVAIFNVGKYLRACLDSIASQNLTGVEVILLDDGSTDDCPAICDEYAERYPSFVAVHQPNRGVSVARNAIIERARGRWLTFVDGDDRLALDAINTFRRYRESEAEVVVFDHLELRSGKSMPTYQQKHPAMELTSQEELKRYASCAMIRDEKTRIIYDGFSIPAVWGKLFQVDFLRENQIWFDPALPKAQDTAFTFFYCHLVNKLVIEPIPVYHYRMNSGSITVRFSPRMAEYCTALMNSLMSTITHFGDTDSWQIMGAYYRLILCQLRTMMNLGSHHPDCSWNLAQRAAYLRAYCDQPFFAEALTHYDEMPEYVHQWIPWKQELLRHDYKSICLQYSLKLKKIQFRNFLEASPMGSKLLSFRRRLLGKETGS